MCGLFGYDGSQDVNPMALRILADKNRDRGTHSIGFYGNGKILKSVKNYDKAIAGGINIESIAGPQVLGHNRFATMGAKNVKNAHPFLIEGAEHSFVGAHNGFALNDQWIRNQYSYDHEIDSVNILQLVADWGVNELSFVEGPLALSWVEDETLHLFRRDSKYLHVGRCPEGIYYSSEAEPLRYLGIPEKKIRMLDANYLYKFRKGKQVGRKHVDEPILKWDQKKGEPKLPTWKSFMVEELKSRVFEATSGEHDDCNYVPPTYRRNSGSSGSGYYDDWDHHDNRVRGFQQHKIDYSTSTEATRKEMYAKQDKESQARQMFADKPTRDLKESEFFDTSGDASIFTAGEDIKAMPDKEMKHVTDFIQESKTKVNGTNISIKLMKENGPMVNDIEPAKDVIVKVAGIKGLYMTDDNGIVTFNVQKPHNDTERRIYMWDTYDLDDKPMYTKRIKMMNSTVVEVTVILPFRSEETNSEEDANSTSSSCRPSASEEYAYSQGEAEFYDEFSDYRRFNDVPFDEGSESCASKESGNDGGSEDAGGNKDNSIADAVLEEGDDTTKAALLSLNKADLEDHIWSVETSIENEYQSSYMDYSTINGIQRLIDIAKKEIKRMDEQIIKLTY
jgi:hypothetical protein